MYDCMYMCECVWRNDRIISSCPEKRRKYKACSVSKLGDLKREESVALILDISYCILHICLIFTSSLLVSPSQSGSPPGVSMTRKVTYASLYVSRTVAYACLCGPR